MTRPKLTFTTAKAKVAAVWSTLAALQVFLGALLVVLEDNQVGAEEITPLITGALTMGVTVWRVWATPNTLRTNDSSPPPRV